MKGKFEQKYDGANQISSRSGAAEIVRGLKVSPRYHCTSDRVNLISANRAITPTVETVGNAIRKDKELIQAKDALSSPDRKCATSAVCSWGHRRDSFAVYDQPFTSRVYAISWAGSNGLEDVPILAAISGASLNIGPRVIRYPKINDSPNGGLARGPEIQTGRHARRCVDDDDAMADKR